MQTLIALLLLSLLTLAILYREPTLRGGSIAFAAAWLVSGLVATWMLSPIVLLLLIAVLVVLNTEDLRRKFFTAPALKALSGMMPSMSDTEREALESGTTWWEKDLFCGKPDWGKFEAISLPVLSEEEQSFIDNEVEQLCAMIDDWRIHHELKDLPEEVWQFMRDKGFFGLIIPKEFGGRYFGPYAQSRIMSKIATRSITAAVTAMVPNSLGPGELLAKYGTEEQKQYWLPSLASGKELPCFGLTGPEVGSDASALPDRGVVCRGEYQGEEVLGLRLNFSKRWITLAPVATVVGLAFKLYDPDKLLSDEVERGITCALIPADTPGVEIGRRHNPGAPFMNGPILGMDVFVPLDSIIGGEAMIGKGWRMLVECLGAGRGISLPAIANASGEMTYRMVGAYSRIRRQFKTAVGDFEGVQEASAEIAASAYTLEAMRMLVTRSLEDGAPSVVTAIAKYHSTEMMRELIDQGMDILGGRGIQMGPRNFMALPYQSVPVGITVEGANILTRSLMIFGQGALRCHPYLQDELITIQSDDKQQALEDFDRLLRAHLGYTMNRFSRAVVSGFSGGLIGAIPDSADTFHRKWYRLLNRYSAVLSVTADFALAALGGDLKRRELLSARLGDVHSQLLIACAILKYHDQLPRDEANYEHAQYALQRAFYRAHIALCDFYRNFTSPWLGKLVLGLFFPWGAPVDAPDDNQIRALGKLIMEPSCVREAMGEMAYVSLDPQDAAGRVETTYRKLLEVEQYYLAFLKADDRGQLEGEGVAARLEDAGAKGIIPRDQVQAVKEYDDMRYDCLVTDAFDMKLEKSDVRIERPV